MIEDCFEKWCFDRHPDINPLLDDFYGELLECYKAGWKRSREVDDALDALLKAEREKALREVEKNLKVYAPHLVDGPEHDVGYYHGYVTALHRVLDLISEDATGG
jgi:hypothetical protein